MSIGSPSYDERYCAFVDILGFRQLIDRLSSEASQFEALRVLLARVHGAKSGQISESGSDFRAQSISDAVAISTLPSREGLNEIFQALKLLAVDLLVEGYFIRGAVVRAPLYHDDQMVFGRALVQAYSLETDVVKYPRIMVAREVREDIVRFSATPTKLATHSLNLKCLRQSTDGPMFLDVLEPIVSLFKKGEHPYQAMSIEEKAMHRKFLSIRDRIQSRYEESMDTPRHFEKVRWFAKYWNDAIPSNMNLRIRDADRTF